MSLRTITSLLTAAVLLVTTASCSAIFPAADARIIDCNTLTPLDVSRALREVPSYEVAATGTVVRVGSDGTSSHEVEIRAHGAYVAPDRLRYVETAHGSELEEVVAVGGDHWSRAHGSLRFESVPPTGGPNR